MPTDPADHPTADLLDAALAALAEGDHELADMILHGDGEEPDEPVVAEPAPEK